MPIDRYGKAKGNVLEDGVGPDARRDGEAGRARRGGRSAARGLPVARRDVMGRGRVRSFALVFALETFFLGVVSRHLTACSVFFFGAK